MNDNKGSIFFSIIIPVYNAEKYLKECLDSIFKQDYGAYEVIIIDDGSTDLSSEIYGAYINKYSDICTVLKTTNQGVSSARNCGIDLAKGEYVVFVDGDDRLGERYLNDFYELLSRDCKIDLAVCGISVNGRNIVLGGVEARNGYYTKDDLYLEFVSRKSMRGFIFNKAFKRRVLVDNKISFNIDVHMCEDLLFCVEVLKHINVAYFLNNPNYIYRIHDTSSVHIKKNVKMISVVNSYSKIIEILELESSKEAVEIAKTNLLIHYSSIYMDFHKDEQFASINESAKSYIRENIKRISFHEIGFKLRIKVILICFLTYIN